MLTVVNTPNETQISGVAEDVSYSPSGYSTIYHHSVIQNGSSIVWYFKMGT